MKVPEPRVGEVESRPVTANPSTRIRLARPSLDEREARAVARVLESGMLVSGALVERFEHVVRERLGRAHAVAVANGTLALELSMRALNLEGREILVPSLTWPSPAHAALVAGARPALVDVDPHEWNLTPEGALASLGEATRAIVLIDQFGVPARIEALEAALRERGREDVVVIEDAACAIGSSLSHQGSPRACGSFGVVSTLSFHPRKVITTGEGGMCLTDDPELAGRLRVLRNHGQASPGAFERAGSNARITEFQAAIGLVQLEKLDAILARRREIAARYREGLRDAPLTSQAHPEGSVVNEQTFGVALDGSLDGSLDGTTRDRVLALASEEGVELGRLSYDLGALPSLASCPPRRPLEVSPRLAARGFALPLHGALTDEEVERVIAVVQRSIQRSIEAVGR